MTKKAKERLHVVLSWIAIVVVLGPVDLNPLLLWGPYRKVINEMLNYPRAFMLVWLVAFTGLGLLAKLAPSKERRPHLHTE